MKRLIKYEYRKIWNRITIIAVVLMSVLTLAMTCLGSYFHGTIKVIDSNGDITKGPMAHFVLRRESKEMEGLLNGEYLDRLLKNYNNSAEKEVFQKEPHLMKYRFVNYFINAIYYRENMMPFYGNLDFEFIKSEESFYDEYRNFLKESVRKANSYKGVKKYNEEELKKIDLRIDKMEFPLKVGYDKGLINFIESYAAYFVILIIVLIFTLTTIFARDTNNGVDELILTSKYGKSKSMKAKIISGNLFIITVYLIYISLLFLIHGIFASLDGFSNSAQLFWIKCTLNITLGQGILIMLLRGILGVLTIGNLTMLVAIRVKKIKVCVLVSMFLVGGLLKGTYTAEMIKLIFNPIYMITSLNARMLEFEPYYFIGNIMIPYTLIVIGTCFFYIVVINFISKKLYSKYWLR